MDSPRAVGGGRDLPDFFRTSSSLRYAPKVAHGPEQSFQRLLASRIGSDDQVRHVVV
jgi:hypothetical protein